MSETRKLNAQKRNIFGKKVKKLRQQNLIPANIFGNKVDSAAISVSYSEFKDIYKKAGETAIITLSIEGEGQSRPVLISNLQVSPVAKKLLHIDFRQVDLKQKITTHVPVQLIGQSPAVAKGAIIVTLKDELEIEALPTDIPEKIEFDISALKEIGDTFTAKDISVDKSKVTFSIEENEIIVQAQEATKEEVVVAPEVTPEATEETKGKEETKTKEEAKAPAKENK